MNTYLTALCAAIIILGGCQSAPVKDCVCPPEQVLINTQGGLLHFEPGELDKDLPYILRGSEVEDFYRRIEREALKNSGGAS